MVRHSVSGLGPPGSIPWWTSGNNQKKIVECVGPCPTVSNVWKVLSSQRNCKQQGWGAGPPPPFKDAKNLLAATKICKPQRQFVSRWRVFNQLWPLTLPLPQHENLSTSKFGNTWKCLLPWQICQHRNNLEPAALGGYGIPSLKNF